MNNLEIARAFDLIADLLELKGENPFRIRAYRRASRILEGLTEDVETLAAQGRLDGVPGIGLDLAGKIGEYLETGRMEALESLRREVPAGLADLMDVPGRPHRARERGLGREPAAADRGDTDRGGRRGQGQDARPGPGLGVCEGIRGGAARGAGAGPVGAEVRR